jgi:hypothetical protein
MEIQWYRYLAIFSLVICLAACLWHLIRLIRLGKPGDFSKPAGEINPAVRYAFTGAMNPSRKESALLHLPTYFAGIVYHLGTFLSLALFFAIVKNHIPSGIFALLLSSFLLLTGLAGIGIFIRRIAMRKIRMLSNPDDYISNLLVTFLHLVTSAAIHFQALLPAYFILYSILMLYLPLGKLKHTIYFFAARYLLGQFFGWRGVWPPGKINT